MEGRWQCIYSCAQLHKIEIVKAVLEDNDIQSVVVDKRDSSNIVLGDIEVYVTEEDAILAKIILEQNEL